MTLMLCLQLIFQLWHPAPQDQSVLSDQVSGLSGKWARMANKVSVAATDCE